jgi:hypothetical protein
MKVNACRAPLPGYAGDQEDILFLVRKMELKTFAQVEEVYHRFFPRDQIPEQSRLSIEGVLEKARSP